MNILEMKQKRSYILRQAQHALLSDKPSEAKITEAKALMAEADVLDEQILAEEERALNYAAMPPRPQPGEGVASGAPSSYQSETRQKFSDYIRFGRQYEETRDLTTGAGNAGAALIPQEFYPVLTEAKRAWGGIVNEINLKGTDSGAPMKVALANDTYNMLNLDTEPAIMNEVEPTLTPAMLACDPLKTDIIKVTVAELQDSFFDLDSFIRDIFGKRYYRGLTNLITTGSWAGSPAVAQNIQSIISGAFDCVTSAAPNAISWGDIVNMYGALDPAYAENAIWAMKSTTRALLLGVTDSLGRPLYVPAPTAQAFDTLLGRRVVFNQFMAPVAAGNVALQFGDFKQGYLLREVKPGLAIVRLNERYMDNLEVGFLGYCRAGGMMTDAGTHPIINLTQHS